MNECLTNIFGMHYPKEIVMLIMTSVPLNIRINCGGYHNTILYKNKIYVWGSNFKGQLGLGDYDDRMSPTEIILHKNIKSVACGWDITVAHVSNSTELYIWGYNDDNALGSIYAQKINLSIKLMLNVDSNIKSVSCGQSHVIILLRSGKCYGWGMNDYGQLGLGHTDNVDSSSPQEITSLGDIIKIGCSSRSLHCIAVAKSGKCYSWGYNSHGQLGLGLDSTKVHSPQELSIRNIISIGCGYRHTIVTTSDNKTYVWGNNESGQLGLGHNINQNSPQELSFSDIKFESVTCGARHTIALTMNGKLYAWGSNNCGQLGLNDLLNRNFPHEIHFKESITSIKSIHSSLNHTICVTHDGKIYTWGDNDSGQLGLGDKNDRSEPCRIKFFS